MPRASDHPVKRWAEAFASGTGHFTSSKYNVESTPTEARRFSELEKRFKLQVDLKDDPQLKRGEMRIYNTKKQDLTKQVVGSVPGT